MTMDLDFVLILQEVSYHPNSYITKLKGFFENPSVIVVSKKDALKNIKKKPMFDERYLVLFEDIRLFKANMDDFKFSLMFPVVVVPSAVQVEDVRFLCGAGKLRYKIMVNEFTKAHAYSLIQSEASEEVSQSICDAIISHVGLNPIRIITAISVCEQVGYKKSNIEKYIDKWTYTDLRSVIDCLLGVPKSKKAIKNALLYLYLNRHWFNTVRKNLISEVDAVLKIYKDRLDGVLNDSTTIEYIEINHVPRARIHYANSLFSKVSISALFRLREQLKSASIFDLTIALS